MNVFVVGTGRCGTLAFAKACSHIRNYTSAHESNMCGPQIGWDLATFPRRHIEVDPHLSWQIPALRSRYGTDALFVHLLRNKEDVVNSLVGRMNVGAHLGFPRLVRPLYGAMTSGDITEAHWRSMARYWYSNTVDMINACLAGTRHMHIDIECAEVRFKHFCEEIGAEVDISRAILEFSRRHNASKVEYAGQTEGT